MREWTDKDASGKKLTDGRICLVITSDSDPSMPPIRTYGKDKDEVLEKLAITAGSAQETIHRLRATTSKPATATPPVASQSRPTDQDLILATADLSNPAKAPNAIKTLLKAGGVDVDAQAIDAQGRKVAQICKQWETAHPEFPSDPRNQRMLIDRAIVKAGGYAKITEQVLDVAYGELLAQNMFFEVTVQPDGNPDSRTGVRMATSHRRNALRAEPPAPASVQEESAKVQRWRKILESGNSKELRNAIENERGFSDWVNQQTAKTA